VKGKHYKVTAVLQRTATSVLESAAALHESVKCLQGATGSVQLCVHLFWSKQENICYDTK